MMTMPVTIKTIMTRNIITVDMDATLRSVRDILDHHSFHHMLVVEDGRLVGVISDRDVLEHTSPFVGTLGERRQDAASLSRKAHQIMSRSLVSVDQEATIVQAGKLMLERKVSCLPVIGSHEGPIGLVTWRDLLLWSLTELHMHSEAA